MTLYPLIIHIIFRFSRGVVTEVFRKKDTLNEIEQYHQSEKHWRRTVNFIYIF